MRERPQPAASKPPRTQEAPPPPAAVETNQAWYASLGEVKPLAPNNRAEIRKARPEPVVRPKTAVELEKDTEKTNSRTLPWYEGVTPLKTDGRIEPRRWSTSNPDDRLTQDTALDFSTAHHLKPLDDQALFRTLMSKVSALPDTGRITLELPKPLPHPRSKEADERAVLGESLIAGLSVEDRLNGGDEAAFLREGVARRVLTDLRKGRWVVQDELDLHGLTRETARETLALFLAGCLRKGVRCVRIIHGKGKGSPGRTGVLRHLSKGWLSQRKEILAFCQAKPHEGGEGALRVLLQAKKT